MFISRLSKIIVLSVMLLAGRDAGAMLKKILPLAPNLLEKNFSITPLYTQEQPQYKLECPDFPYNPQINNELERLGKETHGLKQDNKTITIEKAKLENEFAEHKKLTAEVLGKLKNIIIELKESIKQGNVELTQFKTKFEQYKQKLGPLVNERIKKIIEKCDAKIGKLIEEIKTLTDTFSNPAFFDEIINNKNLHQELEILKAFNLQGKQKIKELTRALQEFGCKFDDLKNKYDADIAEKDWDQEKINKAYEENVANLVKAFKKTIETLEKKYEKELKKITDALGTANKTIAGLKAEEAKKPSWWSRFLEGRKWKGEAKQQKEENENLKKEIDERKGLTKKVFTKIKKKQAEKEAEKNRENSKLKLENGELKFKIETLEKEKKVLEEMLKLAKQYKEEYDKALKNQEGFNESAQGLLGLTHKNEMDAAKIKIEKLEQEIKDQKLKIEKLEQEIKGQKQEVEKPTQNQKNEKSEKKQQQSSWWDGAKWWSKYAGITGFLCAAAVVITYWYSHTPEHLEQYDKNTRAPQLQRKIEYALASKDLDGLKKIFADERNQKLYEYLNSEELAKKALEYDFIDGLELLLKEKRVEIVDLEWVRPVKLKFAGNMIKFNKLKIINNLYHYAQTLTALNFLGDQIKQLNSNISAYNTAHKDWIQKIPFDEAEMLNTLVLVPGQNGLHLKTALDFYMDLDKPELIETAKKLGAKTGAEVLEGLKPYKQIDPTKLTPEDVVDLNNFELGLHRKLLSQKTV